MLTQVSKGRAVLNGVPVKAERVSLSSYKAGQFFIRAYVNCHGYVQYEVLRIVGKPYKSDSKYVSNQRIMTLPAYRSSYNNPYFVSDLGLMYDEDVGDVAVYRYTAKTIQLIEHLANDQDVPNALRFIRGFETAEEIREEILDMAMTKEYDDELDNYYYN
jgi:hypothetical protein